MIAWSWDGWRTTAIAAELPCHPQTVRERIVRFNAEGIDGLGDRMGAGHKARLTHEDKSRIVALVAPPPPGQLQRQADGSLEAEADDAQASWTLDALVEAAHALGIQVKHSQLRRVLRAEGVRWRRPRSWATSTDPDVVPKGRRSSHSIPTRP